MDVYLNDLKLEAKTKEFEEENSDISDSEKEDDYDKVEFKAIFIPGMRCWRLILDLCRGLNLYNFLLNFSILHHNSTGFLFNLNIRLVHLNFS
jgi:hypothetical protein